MILSRFEKKFLDQFSSKLLLQLAINRGALRPSKICPLKKRPSIFLSNALLISKFLLSCRINRQKHRHEYTDNTLTMTAWGVLSQHIVNKQAPRAWFVIRSLISLLLQTIVTCCEKLSLRSRLVRHNHTE